MKERVLKVLEEYNVALIEGLDKDLLASGLIDSFDVVKIVIELEDEFDISIDVDSITPESFRCVNSIIELISKYVEE